VTYEELERLVWNAGRPDMRWRAYISAEHNFFNDQDCPEGFGEIRIRMGDKNSMVGRIVLNPEQLAAHTEESLQLLIDEIGISALLSNGDLTT
jgi:hypothetical protein